MSEGKRWFIADLHLGHRKAAEDFKNPDGTPLRPFGDLSSHDDALISNINQTCDPSDTLFILGDMGWSQAGFNRLAEIHCRVEAVLGNHDRQKIHEYGSVFKRVHGALYMQFPEGRAVLTHIPIHTDCVGRFGLNIHGHLHNNVVLGSDGNPDPRYLCVSVERTGFFPLTEEVVRDRLRLLNNLKSQSATSKPS